MKYAIFSDIHANLEALNAVLSKCERLRVDKYISLGDIVGYNANPQECVDRIRSLDLAGAVKGNHDEYASNNSQEMEGFNPHARDAILWTKSQLNEESRQWLASLPLRSTIPQTGITIVHSTLDSPEAWGYIFDIHHAADNFSYQFTPLCFCGHSHVPIAFMKKPVTSASEKPIDEIMHWSHKRNESLVPDVVDVEDSIMIDIKSGYKYLVNVGSVGQPRNRDPRASFVVYDSVVNTLTRYRIPYDIELAQSKIREAKLPERLATRLLLGN
ncbi:metallophosphoesterase family protein [Lentisphaerota bacterium WC36G]|nr:metallophosphatase family protein [Lentisphaerae bacterium WC36]